MGGHAHFSSADAKGQLKEGGPPKGTFLIRHYAGDVSYSSRGLLEKNKDALYPDAFDNLGFVAKAGAPGTINITPSAGDWCEPGASAWLRAAAC